ncbi:nitrilase-related carbon-nitrogen hydrolase [Microvirga sp. RSM25]|jgi:predicted amidohydrolase|uniref:nitrilase-related carbon-nitrogen hydrolase n=1 Tax=Microvirga sp. RSM25 TaxID=3273802 RepID=UPI00384AF67A
MSLLKVAAAQIETPLGELDTNRRKHLDVIDDARAAGVQVLLFPELSLAGHSGGREAPRLALTPDHATLRELSRASGDMLTVVGGVEEAPGALFFNSAFGLSGGKVVFVYRKINLATYGRLEDGKFFGAGKDVRLHPMGSSWQACVMICADLWNPALVHVAAMSGASLLLAPISSAREAVGEAFDNSEGWAVNARFHAMTYGFPLVLANRVGREGDLSFWGGSRILDPTGRMLAQAGDKEALITAEIDYESVRQARFLLPTVRDGAAALLARAFARLAGECAS